MGGEWPFVSAVGPPLPVELVFVDEHSTLPHSALSFGKLVTGVRSFAAPRKDHSDFNLLK